ACKRAKQALEIPLVPGFICEFADQNRIVAPDDGAPAEAPGEIDEQREDGFGFGHGRFQRPGIAGDGELEHEGAGLGCEAFQDRAERGGVAAPEDESLGLLGAEGYAIVGTAIGVGDQGIAPGEASLEPLAIERRNVGAVAGGDDHRRAASAASQVKKAKTNPPAIARPSPKLRKALVPRIAGPRNNMPSPSARSAKATSRITR